MYLSKTLKPSKSLSGFALVTSATFLIAGCSVGPDFLPPSNPATDKFIVDDKPARPGKSGLAPRTVWGGDIGGSWWKSFRSPSLNRLIDDALTNSPTLESAEAALRLAQTQIAIQRASLFPVIGVSALASRQKESNTLAPPLDNGSFTYSLNTGQLSIAFVPDIWGGTRRQIESAQAETLGAAFQREAVYTSLVSNVALAAIMEGSLRGQITATRSIIGTQSQLLEILRRQFSSGQIGRPDVVAQETAVAQARLLLPPLERALAQQRNLIAALTGRMPDERINAIFTLGSFRLPSKIPLRMPADLIRSRPDVRIAEEHLRSTNAQIGVAVANRLPQIALTANAGSSAQAMAQLFSPGFGVWNIAGNLSQTVFDAGRLAALQRGAEFATDQAAAQYKTVVLQAFQNVADTLRALQSDERAVYAAIAAERSASLGIRLLRQQVEAGQISLPLLLAAQQAHLQTSLARIQAEGQRLSNTVALFQALGGGWWNRPNSISRSIKFASEVSQGNAVLPPPM